MFLRKRVHKAISSNRQAPCLPCGECAPTRANFISSENLRCRGKKMRKSPRRVREQERGGGFRQRARADRRLTPPGTNSTAQHGTNGRSPARHLMPSAWRWAYSRAPGDAKEAAAPDLRMAASRPASDAAHPLHRLRGLSVATASRDSCGLLEFHRCHLPTRLD